MTNEILLDTASEVVERSVGLRLDPAQRYRLDYWLHHTAEQRGVADSVIVEEIAAEGPALQACLDELTVQETSFFRDPAQIAAFRRDVVPTLHSPLTVWSAGCAWGHEPYTIAMVLAESGIAKWQVVASDISSRALHQAAAGRYDERQLTGLGEKERSRYLRRAGDQWEIVPELRSKVTVFRHNLIRDPAPVQPRGAEVVFCRNVLIYFDRADVLAALERIRTTMDPRGWVFLGYSESLWQVTERFHLVRVGTAFAYRQPEWVPADPAAQVLPVPDYPSHSRGPSKRIKPTTKEAAGDAAHGNGGRAATYAEARGGARPAVPAGAKLGSAHALPVPPPARSAPLPAAPPPRPTAPATDHGCADPSIPALLAEGEAGLQAGDAVAAVAALRKVVYLDPDHAIAHFQLGLAFELQGEWRQARRAFSVARAALGRSSAAAEVALEGYQIEELVRLIDHRLTRTPEA
ncbi:MAG: CheR family methyltransferase [Candidatus Dormibacteria bacterium]|jgi:chemotaxis protein methyltransferase CheR